MKLLYLGTAASEGIPALFCNCEHCQKARRAGGKELRTRAAAIIDETLKIDFGPDSFAQMLRFGLDFSALRSVLITHTHGDHLQPEMFRYRFPPFSQLKDDDPPVTVYGNEKVGELMKPITEKAGDRVRFHLVRPFQPMEIDGYTVTALEGVHCVTNDEAAGWPVLFQGRILKRTENALFYLIEKDGARILYAHDTAEFSQPDIDYLAGKRIDLVSLDCTGASQKYDYVNWVGHTSHDGCLRVREQMIASGAADEYTVFVANHFSHNGYTSIEEMQAIMPGFIISYDSLEIDTDAVRAAREKAAR